MLLASLLVRLFGSVSLVAWCNSVGVVVAGNLRFAVVDLVVLVCGSLVVHAICIAPFGLLSEYLLLFSPQASLGGCWRSSLFLFSACSVYSPFYGS